MMTRCAIAAGLCMCLLRLSVGASAGNVTDQLPDLEARLESLEPSDPMAYFELAEEVADVAANETDEQLARHLFRLAGALDPNRLGRSACLALADLEPSEQERRRLLALASLLQTRGGGVIEAISSDADDVSVATAVAVSTALGRYRSGQGHQATDALTAPGAIVALERHEALLPSGGLKRFLQDCRTYTGGGDRPNLSDTELLRMLQLEAALLAGSDRSWSSELMRSNRRTLIEVDPDELGRSLGVDERRAWYRSGRWTDTP